MRDRPAWDFGYAPIPAPTGADDDVPCDVVVATALATTASALEAALAPLVGDGGLRVEILLARAPLFWFRVQARTHARRADVARTLAMAGVAVRYVASARRGDLAIPPPLEWNGAAPARPAAWQARRARASLPDDDPGRWFLGEEGGGVAVDREVCGTGAGTRLAVIDDDAADVERLELDALVPVGIPRVPESCSHGPLMVAWATSARRTPGGRAFEGVAPDAAARLYVIPKPDTDVVSFPLAIARAVLDGADVVLCATYVEGTSSPMLDDALEVASRLGRGGRGAAVIFAAGRETSSPAGSVHASLSLSLGDPASDPRAACIAPGARDGGWFLWQDRSGRVRPFANRGPAVRWLAPGDDIAYPFASKPRLFHAESSGAAAIAAGVVLLVMGTNPTLSLREVNDLLTRTAVAPRETDADTAARLADPEDVHPVGRDPDGHDAKHGYGRLHATAACLAAKDPFALVLVRGGEMEAALRLAHDRAFRGSRRLCSPRLGRWCVRALLADPSSLHALAVLARHGRLVAMDPHRGEAHPKGALARQLYLVVRGLTRSPRGLRMPPLVARELGHIARCLAILSDHGTYPDEVESFEAGAALRFTQAFAEVRRDSARTGPAAEGLRVPSFG